MPLPVLNVLTEVSILIVANCTEGSLRRNRCKMYKGKFMPLLLQSVM